MITADGLFILDPKAEATGYGIGRKFAYSAAIAAATAVSVDMSSTTNGITPGDKIRNVRQIGYRMTAGAAQTIAVPGMIFFVLGRGGVNDVLYEFGEGSGIFTGLTDAVGSMPCDLVLMPGEYIYATGTFSAAVNNNAVQVWVSSLEIPRGNFQH